MNGYEDSAVNKYGGSLAKEKEDFELFCERALCLVSKKFRGGRTASTGARPLGFKF